MFWVYQHHLNDRPVVIVEARTERAAADRAWEHGVDLVNRCEACGDTIWVPFMFGRNRFHTLPAALEAAQPKRFEVIYINQEVTE